LKTTGKGVEKKWKSSSEGAEFGLKKRKFPMLTIRELKRHDKQKITGGKQDRPEEEKKDFLPKKSRRRKKTRRHFPEWGEKSAKNEGDVLEGKESCILSTKRGASPYATEKSEAGCSAHLKKGKNSARNTKP